MDHSERVQNISNTNLVTQANKLVEARYDITKNEQLIIEIMTSFINPNDSDFLTYKTSVHEFADILQVDRKSYKREIKTVINRLLSRVVEVETPNGWKMHQWVSYAEIDEKEDLLVLRFHNELKPYLLQLRKQFLSYKIIETLHLKSVYSLRMYKILREHQGLRKTTFTYTLDDYRKMMLGSRSKKYPQFKYFRTYILNASRKELNEKTSLSFDFKTIRIGRKIGKIEFTIININNHVQKEEDIALLKSVENKVKNKPQVLAEYEDFGVVQAKAEPFYQERGEQSLLNTLDYFKKQLANGKEVKNKGGYLFTLLKANAGQEIEIERKEAERRAQERNEEFKKLEEKQQKDRRSKAENKHLRTVKDVYLSSLSEQQKQQLFNELKEKYEAEHGDCGLITDLKSGFISSLLDAIITNLPLYKKDREEMIQVYLRDVE